MTAGDIAKVSGRLMSFTPTTLNNHFRNLMQKINPEEDPCLHRKWDMEDYHQAGLTVFLLTMGIVIFAFAAW